MKITVLTENTISKNAEISKLPLQEEHGLSLFIQTQNKNILFDMGQTNLFAKNASLLGINLQTVDFAILSHGHYDHGGLSSPLPATLKNEYFGIEAFAHTNQKAPIFINSNAFSQNYNASKKYIGLNQELLQSKIAERFVFVQDEKEITQNIKLFSCNSYKKLVATNAFGLMQLQNGTFVPDNFNHEHYLLIQENDKKILISGCSHKGILNIVEWFKPDFLIGGFHFKSLDVENPCQKLELESYAKKLASYNTKYFTCHCTGTQQFEILKSIMKEKVEYISTGDVINIF
ncbi:MAG: MBL fold metallo-hydrolase [Treponema bryantii]|nr:MBL fold metallo-hydrolase [Treponema bryantii]